MATGVLRWSPQDALHTPIPLIRMALDGYHTHHEQTMRTFGKFQGVKFKDEEGAALSKQEATDLIKQALGHRKGNAHV